MIKVGSNVIFVGGLEYPLLKKGDKATVTLIQDKDKDLNVRLKHGEHVVWSNQSDLKEAV